MAAKRRIYRASYASVKCCILTGEIRTYRMSGGTKDTVVTASLALHPKIVGNPATSHTPSL